jgi:hypothetical protein
MITARSGVDFDISLVPFWVIWRRPAIVFPIGLLNFLVLPTKIRKLGHPLAEQLMNRPDMMAMDANPLDTTIRAEDLNLDNEIHRYLGFRWELNLDRPAEGLDLTDGFDGSVSHVDLLGYRVSLRRLLPER